MRRSIKDLEEVTNAWTIPNTNSSRNSVIVAGLPKLENISANQGFFSGLGLLLQRNVPFKLTSIT
jgi:hypothetical protein